MEKAYPDAVERFARMYPPGHVGITLVLYAPVAAVLVAADRDEEMVAGLVVVVAFALLPDIDAPLPGVAHRGVTHSLLAAAYFGIVAGVLAGASAPSAVDRAGRTAFGSLLGSLGVVSHLLGDVITPMGVRPFFPASRQVYTLDLVRASNPGANLAMLAVGVAVLWGAVQHGRARKHVARHQSRRGPKAGDRGPKAGERGRQAGEHGRRAGERGWSASDHRGVRSDGSGPAHSRRFETGERTRYDDQ